MNLPFVLDVAIGLIFIYLILSLLASEIQELLTTLLQWRAKHLKDAIEVLLAGGTGTQQEKKVKNLVSKLYNDPLIKNINQEAKGFLARGFRKVTRWLIPGNRKGAFGANQESGPSYIAPDTFATSLLERLGLATLVDKLVEVRLKKFVYRIVGQYSVDERGVIIPDDDYFKGTSNWDRGRIRVIADKAGKKNLNNDVNFKELVEEYDDIFQDFKHGQATLQTCVERMGESLNAYLATYPIPQSQNSLLSEPNPEENSAISEDTSKPQDKDEIASQRENIAYFVNRLRILKSNLFGEKNERAILSGGLRPTLSEIAELVNESSNTYKEVKDAYEAIKTQGEAIKRKVDAELNRMAAPTSNSEVLPSLDSLSHDDCRLRINEAMVKLGLTQEERNLYENYETYLTIQEVRNQLPSSVKESLAMLARRAQTKIQQTGNEIDQFRDEVARWFDHSMSRTSGVYKRNAKGVAMLIGLLLAVATNSDTFHMVNRLSIDEDLRRIIAEQAKDFAPSTNASPLRREQLVQLRDDADAVLKNFSLPVGWKPENLTKQFNCESSGTSGSSSNSNQACLNSRVPLLIGFLQNVPTKPIDSCKIFLGWLISGVAISMGASFWFDLLGKVINVRNSGGKPPSGASRESKENNP
jgi:hypothetical protein